MSNKSRTLTNILFSCVVFFIFILLFEIVLRHTHFFDASVSWTEPDSQLVFRYTPKKYFWFNRGHENDHPIDGYINNFGWRDNNWTIGKPLNSYRIAVLGDSYVEAFQVETDRTFLALTEKALNNSNKNIKVELMNFGRSGFTQTEELIVLKNEVSQFSPDMVILYFLPTNDIETVRFETCHEARPYYQLGDDGKLILDTSFTKKLSFRFKRLINPIKQHSALISLITEKYNAYRKFEQYEADEISKKKISGFLSLCTDKPDKEILTSYNLNKLLIKKMSDYCRQRGIRFMLVAIDNARVYQPEIEEMYKSMDPNLKGNFFDDDLEKYAEKLNIDFLGLHNIFRESYKGNSIPLHWGHWNYEGHELAAQALINSLEKIVFHKNNKE